MIAFCRAAKEKTGQVLIEPFFNRPIVAKIASVSMVDLDIPVRRFYQNQIPHPVADFTPSTSFIWRYCCPKPGVPRVHRRPMSAGKPCKIQSS